MSLRHLLPPLERTMLGFDLETTHTNPMVARIVEIGIEIMMPDKPTKEYRTLINPTIPIPPSATKIHGITDEMVANAPTFAQLADNLLTGFDGADFCGYNVRFDLRIIAAEFRRAMKLWSYDRARIIDGFRLWQVAEPRSLDDAVEYWIRHRLSKVNPDLAQQFSQEIADAGKSHGALRDVMASSRVAYAQLLCAKKSLPRDVQQLHDLCWPGWFDADGKMQWRNGELCLMFGEHREKSLRHVPRSYLHWMSTKGNFGELVKETCREALKGNFPTPPTVAPEEDPDDVLD